jgi:hypothetical protein
MSIGNLLRHNEHVVDRVLRIVLGLVLLALVVVGPRTYWGLFGLVPLATGLLGSCPLYTLLGISTCSVRRGTGDSGISTGGAGI